MSRFVLFTALLGGCIHLDSDPSESTSSDTGAVEVDLPGAPPGVDCIDLTFANEDGVTTDTARALTGGTLVFGNLAAGAYAVSAKAYGAGVPAPITDADCSFVPTSAPWSTETAQDLVIVGGVRTNTVIRLVPSGRAGVTPVFVDTPHVLAQGQGALGAIAAAGGTVAFIHTGNATTAEIRRVPDVDLGTVEVLATGQSNPSELVMLDTQDVFWTNFATGLRDGDGNRINDGSVWGYVSGTLEILRDGILPSDIASLSDGTVVWGQQDTRTIECATCTSPYLIAPGTPNAVGAFGASVYFDNGDTDDLLGSVSAGVPVVLATTTGRVPIGIAATDTEVFWSDFEASTGTGGVLKAPVAGGAVTTLVDGIRAGFPIVVLDGFVYWTDNVRIARVPADGGDVEDVVVGPIGGIAVARDGDGHGEIYWTDNSHGGLVWRARVD